MIKKFILWDNDGVLVDTEKYYLEANKIVLGEIGIKADVESYFKISLQQGKSILELARSKNYSDEQILELREKRDSIYEKFINEKNLAIDGVQEVMDSLYGKIGMGVVTSTKRSYFNSVHEKTGFHKYFDFVIAREDYQNTKPNPEPYLMGIDKAGCRPNEIVAIEDTERGLIAANKAGLDCIIIRNELNELAEFKKAALVLDSIQELNLDLLYNLNRS